MCIETVFTCDSCKQIHIKKLPCFTKRTNRNRPFCIPLSDVIASINYFKCIECSTQSNNTNDIDAAYSLLYLQYDLKKHAITTYGPAAHRYYYQYRHEILN